MELKGIPYDHTTLELAHRIAARFAELPQVEAVSLTGSQMMGVADPASDIDLYIYHHDEIRLPRAWRGFPV